jgi:transcriptional regulator NrdR family protein
VKCPRCQSDSRVIETREPKRRRQCLGAGCGHRWSTVELSLADVQRLRAESVRLARRRLIANEAAAT